MLEQSMKNCNLCEGHPLDKFVENNPPWKRPYTQAGKECQKPFLVGGRSIRKNMN